MGEWEDGKGAPPSAITAAIAAIDVDASVQQAVHGAMARRLDAVAAAAVDEALDEPTLAVLRLAADEAARRALVSPPTAAPEENEPPELYYATLPAFVSEQLVPMYRRPLGAQGITWCAEWWRHTEAIARLEALWRSWEHLRLDPATGMSVWFRDHADHHMAVLLSADGPFKGCKPDRHGERLEPFPLRPPPDGLFDE